MIGHILPSASTGPGPPFQLAPGSCTRFPLLDRAGGSRSRLVRTLLVPAHLGQGPFPRFFWDSMLRTAEHAVRRIARKSADPASELASKTERIMGELLSLRFRTDLCIGIELARAPGCSRVTSGADADVGATNRFPSEG